MKIDYDAQGDILTMTLSSIKPRYGEDEHPDVVLHVAEDGQIAMIEIMGASRHLKAEDLVAHSPDQLMSLAEAGASIGRSPGTLRLLCESGRLKAVKAGRNWLTTRAWLDSYLESRRGRRSGVRAKVSRKFTPAKAL
ncbi:MAG: DUF2283 domain-containing protein [SAR202 cluster bacterium]|nr:DUF2283 domain-containing protein [SAR202 cluster bacterium]